MSDRVIKATNVKMVGKTAEKTVPTHQGIAGSHVPLQGDASSRSGDSHAMADGLAQVKKEFYEKGLSDGMEFRKKEFAKMFGTMEEVTRQASELRKKLYLEAEEQILQLVFSVAEKVIHTEVGTNRNIVLDVLRAAAKNIVDHDNVKIRLNPEDLRYIMDMEQELFQEVSWLKNSALEEDSSINPGGVLLETVSGEIDARLDQQLAEIKKSFKKR